MATYITRVFGEHLLLLHVITAQLSVTVKRPIASFRA